MIEIGCSAGSKGDDVRCPTGSGGVRRLERDPADTDGKDGASADMAFCGWDVRCRRRLGYPIDLDGIGGQEAARVGAPQIGFVDECDSQEQFCDGGESADGATTGGVAARSVRALSTSAVSRMAAAWPRVKHLGLSSERGMGARQARVAVQRGVPGDQIAVDQQHRWLDRRPETGRAGHRHRRRRGSFDGIDGRLTDCDGVGQLTGGAKIDVSETVPDWAALGGVS